MTPYEAVIGLEIHCQLQTRSKAFSPDSAAFGALPNRHVDPVSLGHPGTLPVLNRRVIEFAVRLGLATHSNIARRSLMARKHYFYPDLPKGYQISQYEEPICVGGYVDIGRRIRLSRIHIEEDAHQEPRRRRAKEKAHDYGSFPDPDLPPVVVTSKMREAIADALPEVPDGRRRRYVEVLGLPNYDAGVLTEERPVADYFEAALEHLEGLGSSSDTQRCAKAVSNLVMGDVLRDLKQTPSEGFAVSATQLAELVYLFMEGDISSTGAQDLFVLMKTESGSAEEIAGRHNLLQVSDDTSLLPVVEQVLVDNPKQVRQYLGGKKTMIGFFIGQVMRRFGGSPDPQRVRALLTEALEALS